MNLHHQESGTIAASVRENLQQIISENLNLSEKIDFEQVEVLIDAIRQSKAIFFIASGRSGYSMRSLAMRCMHLGLTVHFVGDTTTPAIQSGDLLWAASGSGTTGSIVRAAAKARSVGAKVIAITTNPSSELATLSDDILLLPAAEKEDHGGQKSRQYAGSLFEQAVLLIGDAIFMELWKIDGTPAEKLWKRHANME